MLPLQIIPPLPEELIIIHILQPHPPRLPLHSPKDAIFVLPLRPIERAQLGRALHAARGGLSDVNVRDRVGGCVLGDCERDGGEPDCFAQEPGYALLRGG